MKKTLAVLFVVVILAAGAAFLWSCGGGGGGGETADVDRDGYDASVDCDDNASSCTDDCVSDVDGDAVPDCLDLCIDVDLDGYGTDNSSTVVGSGSDDVGSCTSDGAAACSGGGALCLGIDCNDDPFTGGSIHPGAAELCDDGLDNNCNDLIDCYDDATCAADAACTACTDGDGDGYFTVDASCSGGNDCDDTSSEINPGGEGPFGCPAELCTSCVTDADCGTGNRCINLDGEDICVVDCSVDNLCPDGYTCSDVGGGDLQCVPTSNSCSCLPENDGETRVCSSTNGFGTCTGEETCDPVTGWSPCTALDPEAESCDGLDNDCDGDTDEDFPSLGEACTVGIGICERTGTTICTAGGAGTQCDALPGSPATETCNDLDDACNGIVDDDYIAGGTVTYTDWDFSELVKGDSCGTGDCAGGIVVCGSGGLSLTCTTLASAGTETCNGEDDDCDGTVDNDPLPAACPRQMGVCEGSMTSTCEGGSWADCGAAEYGPDYEAGNELTCDGLDNDCDGNTDEGLAGLLCPEQDGVCAGSREVCGGASGWLACGASSYGSDYESVDELTCDGLDNDCDGTLDEGSLCGAYLCQSGACTDSCTDNSGCAMGYFCSGASQCEPVKNLGEICAANFECGTGNCADGVCCDNTCGSTCQSCVLAGRVGQCTYIVAGTDPDNECAGDAACDGAGGCIVPTGGACSADVECLSGFCRDGFCCGNSCDGVCRSCGITGLEGSCILYSSGSDPDNECTDPDVCNGAGACTTP